MSLDARLRKLEQRAAEPPKRRRVPHMDCVFVFADPQAGRLVKAVEGGEVVDYDEARHGGTRWRVQVRDFHLDMADLVAGLGGRR